VVSVTDPYGCILDFLDLAFAIHKPKYLNGSTLAQSVYNLDTGWTTEGSGFDYRNSQEFSLLNVVQTGSGVHPAS
jgi:hypothetical protein